MKLTLAFSTCPNDTFIFNALVKGLVAENNITFDYTMADIQVLNSLALGSQVDIVKISYALYPLIYNEYQLLTAGSALGKGVGPLVVSKRKIFPDEVPFAKVAIPGENTTANMLFGIAFPSANQREVMLFSDIEDAILSNHVDAGVIIHESRFTYMKKGLIKIVDLGDLWEEQTNLPIPLGGIAIRRSLPNEVKRRVNNLIRLSVEEGLTNPAATYPFVKQNAQAMDLEVMQNHINLYVNSFTQNLGELGEEAVKVLFNKYEKSNNAKFIMHYNNIFAL